MSGDAAESSRTMRQIVRRGIAEFFVIVLGVLVALGVDDFRAGQADRATERQLLERLARDLVADSTDIAQASGQAAARMAAGLRLLTTLGEDDTVLRGLRRMTEPYLADTVSASPPVALEGADAFAADLQTALYTNVFDPTSGVFAEITSTGTLTLIRDVDLRSRIVQYYGRVLIIKEGDYKYRDAERDLRLALQNANVGFSDFFTTPGLDRRLASSERVRMELRNVVGIAVFQTHILNIIERRRAEVAARVRQAPGRNSP